MFRILCAIILHQIVNYHFDHYQRVHELRSLCDANQKIIEDMCGGSLSQFQLSHAMQVIQTQHNLSVNHDQAADLAVQALKNEHKQRLLAIRKHKFAMHRLRQHKVRDHRILPTKYARSKCGKGVKKNHRFDD